MAICNTYLTLAEHWDGSQWSVDSTPNPSATSNALYGGVAFSGSDVWSAGTYGDSSGSFRTLAEHWNGSYWSIVATP